MSYEINILVLNQDQPVHLPFKSSIELRNEKEHEGFGRYDLYWPFFSCLPGITYSLVKDEESELLSAFPLCNVDFDHPLSNPCPEWIPEEYAKDNFYPFIVRPSAYSDFVRVLEFLLKNSPNKFLLFQTRYQGGDRDVIFGTISLSEFLSMLNRKEVMSNTCYIIAEKTEIEYPVYDVSGVRFYPPAFEE